MAVCLGGLDGGAEATRVMSLCLINGIRHCISQGSARETKSERYSRERGRFIARLTCRAAEAS